MAMPKPTTDARRAAIEKQRGKVDDAHEKLQALLNEDGHDEDCVLRCFAFPECFQEHSCHQCVADGEV